MLKNSILLSGFFLLCSQLGAQTLFTRDLNGKTTSEGKGVADVHVLNTSAGKATISDENGDFSIPARINDTLLFSAVQFKRKMLVVSNAMLESTVILVPLDEFVNELDEVVVRPYDLSGDLARDMETMKTGQVVSATSLGLPNAHVKPLIQSERLLREASFGPFSIGTLTAIPFNPIINAITGRTKMLKKRVARDHGYLRSDEVRGYFADSLYTTQLKIPKAKIPDFIYFCEVDDAFDSIVSADDKMAIWGFFIKKSIRYRENNSLD